MTLEQLLDLHVKSVRVLAKVVEPGEDIAPLMGIWRNGHLTATVLVELPSDRLLRQMQHERAMRLLAEKEADAYTVVISSWRSGLLSDEEYKAYLASGKGVADRPDRREVVMCIAGDKERTIFQDFDVIRSHSGRIDHLKLCEHNESDTIGLFFDLLLVVPQHQRQ